MEEKIQIELLMTLDRLIGSIMMLSVQGRDICLRGRIDMVIIIYMDCLGSLEFKILVSMYSFICIW